MWLGLVTLFQAPALYGVKFISCTRISWCGKAVGVYLFRKWLPLPRVWIVYTLQQDSGVGHQILVQPSSVHFSRVGPVPDIS